MSVRQLRLYLSNFDIINGLTVGRCSPELNSCSSSNSGFVQAMTMTKAVNYFQCATGAGRIKRNFQEYLPFDFEYMRFLRINELGFQSTLRFTRNQMTGALLLGADGRGLLCWLVGYGPAEVQHEWTNLKRHVFFVLIRQGSRRLHQRRLVVPRIDDNAAS